jgi:hypothetical protein
MVSVEDDLKYTGLHAFIFINELDPGTNIRTVIHNLRDFGPPPHGPVVFAAETVGSSLGFAHVRLDDPNDLRGLQDLIANELWDRGVHCDHCIEKDTSNRNGNRQGVKRDTPEIIAISKLKVRRGEIPQLLDDLADPEGPVGSTFKGASVIFGKWDVLVQLGGDDFQVVAEAVFSDLPRFDAILDSDTLFTDGRH